MHDNTDKAWKCLAAAVKAHDYVLARECLDVLHVVLKRPCAANCGRLAMKGSTHCAPCYSRSPAGRAQTRETVANALADVATVLRADEERRVVATVTAETTPELPAGDER